MFETLVALLGGGTVFLTFFLFNRPSGRLTESLFLRPYPRPIFLCSSTNKLSKESNSKVGWAYMALDPLNGIRLAVRYKFSKMFKLLLRLNVLE